MHNLQNRAAEATANRLQREPVPTAVFGVFAGVLDAIAICASLWFSAFFQGSGAVSPIQALIGAASITGFAIFVIYATSGYRFDALQRFFTGLVQALCVTLGIVLLVSLGSADGPQIVPISTSAVLLAVGLSASRLACSTITLWARDFRLTARNAVILGGGAYAEELIETIDGDPSSNTNILGMFDDRASDRSPEAILGIPKLGRIVDVIPFVRRSKVDMVIIAFPEHAKSRIAYITELLRVLPVDIQLSGLTANFGPDTPSKDLKYASLSRTLRQRPFTRNEALAKRMFDFTVASLAVALFSPVFLLVAIAIKCDSKGPVLFCQSRCGFNGSTVRVYKFRSMYHEDRDHAAKRVVQKNDPRVTRIGRFLRRTSLDELPQLFNVLNGDISLVGPRPHAVGAVYSGSTPFEQLVDSYAMRHRVQPGITGWAQINGWRGEIDSPERLQKRVEHDLFYIENRSMWLDVSILAKTVPALLNTKYAY